LAASCKHKLSQSIQIPGSWADARFLAAHFFIASFNRGDGEKVLQNEYHNLIKTPSNLDQPLKRIVVIIGGNFLSPRHGTPYHLLLSQKIP